MQLKWDDLRLFLAVCDEGSLSAAARIMGLGQATLSRRIAEMEAQVGEPLFVRQSQGVVLTDMGRQLLPSVQRMAEWATQATHSLTTDKTDRISNRMSPSIAPQTVLIKRVSPAMTV